MKDTEFKKVIEGLDLSKDEDKAKLLAAINNSENSLMERKESSFNEKYAALQTQFDTLKTERANDAKTSKELSTKLASIEKDNEALKNKAYIFKNVDNTLDDAGVNDFITLVNARTAMNPKLTFEQAAKEVSTKYFHKEVKTPTPTVAETPVKPEPQVQVGVQAGKASTSVGYTYDDNSSSAQIDRYNKIIGKKR